MPTWDHIEDVSPTPNCVWLTRASDDDLWTPLRKCDCRALNERKGSESVHIEGGRATADPSSGTIKYNFYNAPTAQLTSATWFVREEKSKNEVQLKPLPPLDRVVVEDLYQRAVAATSTLGAGTEEVLKEKYALQEDAEFHVMVVKVGGTLSMKKKHKGWFSASHDLQRGWGEYVVEGEEEELLLGPVSHLLFVVHGIGQAMLIRDYQEKSIVEEVNRSRTVMQKMQVTEWKKKCEKARKAGQPDPPPPNRIELIPIEWYDQIHSSSNALMTSLKATTLESIPALRAIANDVIFDVLMYMTPTFCHSVLECVADQIASLHESFSKVHPGWRGKCCLVGHSLGSVIVWDLLSILKESLEKNKGKQENEGNSDMGNLLCGVSISDVQSTTPHGYQAYATTDEHANKAKNGSWGPTLPKPIKQCIPFVPEFTLFLGSPLGLFLTLRGAHAVFDEMRTLAADAKEIQEEGEEEEEGTAEKEKEEDPNTMVSPFTLPSGSIFNIFHPSDPVAYRIESLLLPQYASDAVLPPPMYLVKQGEDVRFHVKAKQLTNLLAEKTNNWSSLVSAVKEQAVASLHAEVDNEDAPNDKKPRKASGSKPNKFPLGGNSDRVDFQLQPGVIDNEYISAVMAHSGYFGSTDLLEFVVDLVEKPLGSEKQEDEK